MLEADYNKLPGVRWSRLRAMLVSALQYQWELQHEREDEAHFRIGRAIHCYVLEPSEFEKRFVKYTESKSVGPGSKTRWAEFQVKCAAEDVTILDTAEYDKAVGAARALLAHPIAAEFLDGGVKEHLVTWTDRTTGLRCKARLDQAHLKLVDIKSTRDVSPRAFAAACARLAYHGQLAFYHDGADANGLEIEVEPMLLAVQSDPPHDVVCYRMTEDIVCAGRTLYQRLLAQLADCQAAGEFPGQAPDSVIDLELPPWAPGLEREPRTIFMPDGSEVAL